MTDRDGNQLQHFHAATRGWFEDAFPGPTPAQAEAWAKILQGAHTLLLAPTGSGKTLAAFLVAIDRIMFNGLQGPVDKSVTPGDAARPEQVRVLYISPLKALGVDVERNLRAPIAGVRARAEREGFAYHLPTVAVRSGDTPANEREQIRRHPPDILITTPESLYLMLTSRARSALAQVETVIIDEIHSLVSNKRGAHLFLSLERLEHLRRGAGAHAPLQRIGLSATQRPLDEIARLLGGAEVTLGEAAPPPPAAATQPGPETPETTPLDVTQDVTQDVTPPAATEPASSAAGIMQITPRPVEIVQAAMTKQLELKIEVPVEDMTRLGEPTAPEGETPVPSIWPAIHPRLVELIRAHRSTMVFVNSRRLAERLALAINDLAEEELALAHHGSLAKETRSRVEDRLKRGNLPAIVATSSLELGIDMGAVDLVIQIEAPPSIASGLQRIGRAGHQVGEPSRGIVFPKFRGDLLACAAAARAMAAGFVEATYYPRNPLDVLAQQLVAMVALEPVAVDTLYAIVRAAAPFRDLPRSSFDGVLDLLSGRYPSDEFAELRPRVTWDRLRGELLPRGNQTQRIAALNAGTIPDRGLYGVYLVDGEGGSSRVGELDEEMVFETQEGEVFLLGASSWRVQEITSDRVLVVPAPGEHGRMPFWRGDGPGRPLEFGQAIGRLARELVRLSPQQALKQLTTQHALDAQAARNLDQYLRDQQRATGEVPSDQTIVVESFVDEVGDWRVAILSPFGARVHAPWAAAVNGRLQEESGCEVDLVWTDDGILFRLPESTPPDWERLFPSADEIEELLIQQLGGTAIFAARFRENAARALLLPKRFPGRRTPLWLQRRKSANLLAVASRYEQFPILLETYRECLRDVFDLRGLKQVLRDVADHKIRVRQVNSDSASPFASTLLFSYVGNFIYEGDAPLAERRAQTLALDHAQLRELLGDAELRELLDPDVIEELGWELQRLAEDRRFGSLDALHDLLLQLGDLTTDELLARCRPEHAVAVANWLSLLQRQRRIVEVTLAGEPRWIAAEDAARYRDALGAVPPEGLPQAFLEPVRDPVGDLVSRFARTHIPFRPAELAARFGLGVAPIQTALRQLAGKGRVLEGEFLPGGRSREWCDAEVLRTIKRRSLARLRKQVEPVEPRRYADFLVRWHAIDQPRLGLDALLDAVERLQGVPLSLATLEEEILPARVAQFEASDLDELCAAGEIVWRGFQGLSGGDGRVALYLTDQFSLLAPPTEPVECPLAGQIQELLETRGALFFDELSSAVGGFRNDLLTALWQLVWAGYVTNDTLAPLRSLRTGKASRGPARRASGQGSRRGSGQGSQFRSRRTVQLAGSQGRWTLVTAAPTPPTPTERQTALVHQLIQRHGVLTREAVAAEGVPGGFAAIYPILKTMEETGRVRRGYFVSGMGAAQFAAPGADDRLRHTTPPGDSPQRLGLSDGEFAPALAAEPGLGGNGVVAEPTCLVLAATDPANPYGAAVKWPEGQADSGGRRPRRVPGALVFLHAGVLLGYLTAAQSQLLTFPDAEAGELGPQAVRLLTGGLMQRASQHPFTLTRIDGEPATRSRLTEPLREAGALPTSKGLLLRRVAPQPTHLPRRR